MINHNNIIVCYVLLLIMLHISVPGQSVTTDVSTPKFCEAKYTKMSCLLIKFEISLLNL